MQLEQQVIDELKAALIGALDLPDFKPLVRASTGLNYNEVVPDKSTSGEALNAIIEKAEKIDKVHVLVLGALRINSTNQQLHLFALKHLEIRRSGWFPVAVTGRSLYLATLITLLLSWTTFVGLGLLTWRGYCTWSYPSMPDRVQNSERIRELFNPPGCADEWNETHEVSKAYMRLTDEAKKYKSLNSILFQVDSGPCKHPIEPCTLEVILLESCDACTIEAFRVNNPPDKNKASPSGDTLNVTQLNPKLYNVRVAKCKPGDQIILAVGLFGTCRSKPSDPGECAKFVLVRALP